ncbi:MULTISPECIES: hypothetical protein [unclassified Rhizobium]|nr:MULTISPECIES: hypothetical protein [unclassified Rhizobium]
MRWPCKGSVPGLSIVGYRRAASIAFVVEGDQVTVLGVSGATGTSRRI